MSIKNILFLQKSSYSVTILYNNPFLKSPISLYEGSGVNNIMEIDQINDQVVGERTVTGDYSVYFQPRVINGRITLHPQSPAIPQIKEVINNYTDTLGIIAGTVSVKGVGFEYTFTNFVFTSPSFSGYTFNKMIEDYVCSFSCTPPQNANLIDIINAAGGLINVGA